MRRFFLNSLRMLLGSENNKFGLIVIQFQYIAGHPIPLSTIQASIQDGISSHVSHGFIIK